MPLRFLASPFDDTAGPMPRMLACLLAVAGLLVMVPVTPAIADDRDECTRSSWRSTLKKPEKWIIKRESGFSPTAANPTSSAFGLGQLIRRQPSALRSSGRGQSGERGLPLRPDGPV